jgi:RNA polymerase sigma-70 factor (ECF subfamily)
VKHRPQPKVEKRPANREEPTGGMMLAESISPLPAGLITAKAMSDDAPAPTSDIARLTAEMARGDEAAYRTFYQLYFPRLLRYLLVLTGGREDAARDALQIALLRVVRHIRVFELENTFWSWLTVLARSAIVDEERKRHRFLAILASFFQRNQVDATPADGEADARLWALLEKNLATLSTEERELIDRKYFARESVKEIAEAMETTEKAVESRLVRVRRKLKDLVLVQLKDENSIHS